MGSLQHVHVCVMVVLSVVLLQQILMPAAKQIFLLGIAGWLRQCHSWWYSHRRVAVKTGSGSNVITPSQCLNLSPVLEGSTCHHVAT
jgi:hypothetical protein